MKLFSPIQFICTAILVAAAFSGCSKKPDGQVLARVGKKEITVAEFKAEYERRQANRWALPERAVLLGQMIDRETKLQSARAAGLESNTDLRRAYEELLIAKFSETQLAPKIAAATVSEAEVKAAYEKEIARFTQPAKAKLAFVFVAVGAKADTNDVAAAEARIKEVLAQAGKLPAGARGFGAVAAEYSDDQTTRYRGGDAGWFTADALDSRWPKEIVAAGMELKNVGDVSGVLHGGEGFYLVKKLDARAAEVTPLESVRATLTRRLLLTKQQAVEQEFLAQARAAFKVFTNPQALAAVVYPAVVSDKNSPRPLPNLTGNP